MIYERWEKVHVWVLKWTTAMFIILTVQPYSLKGFYIIVLDDFSFFIETIHSPINVMPFFLGCIAFFHSGRGTANGN